MADVFVSYRNEDRRRAGQLVVALETAGLVVWWDRHLQAGNAWRAEIAAKLDEAGCVLVLWSERSAGAEGRFVQDEAERALERGTYLPVLIDSVVLPLGFGGVQAVSLMGWTGDASAPEIVALIARVRDRLDLAPGAATDPLATPRLRRRTLIMGGGAVIGAAAVALTVAHKQGLCTIVGCGDRTAAPSSVAVLPFRNLSGGADQDYLAEGIAEELRSALSHLAEIRVAARISSTAAHEADSNFGAIGRQLGVRYLIDGSVRRGGERVRVGATLIEAATGFERWSQIYDRPINDLLDVQSGIAGDVALALRGALAPADQAYIARLPTHSPAAYDAYLRGIRLFDLGGDQATYQGALASFDRAVALDPAYAAAHAARARTLAAIANQFLKPGAIKPAYAQALSAAQTAVSLAPDLAEAQSALGYVRAYGFLDFAGARAPYARSVALAPSRADILILYGTFAARVEDPRVGIAALRRAVGLDPLNPRAYKALGYALVAARDYDAAVVVLSRAVALSPGMVGVHSAIGVARYLENNLPAASAAFAAEPQRYWQLAGLAITRRKSGDPAAAQSALASLISEEGDAAAYQQAEVYAQWGEAAQAIAALNRARAAGDSGVLNARTDPLLDPIREDPSMRRLLAELGSR